MSIIIYGYFAGTPLNYVHVVIYIYNNNEFITTGITCLVNLKGFANLFLNLLYFYYYMPREAYILFWRRINDSCNTVILLVC